MALYGFVSAAMSLIYIVGILAIFGYGLVKAQGHQRTALLLSGGLLVGSVLLGLVASFVGSFIGLGGIQTFGFVGRLAELVGLGVLVFAFVKQPAVTEAGALPAAGSGYLTPGPYAPNQNQQGQNQQGQNQQGPWQQGQGPHLY
ncbi:hypothetical protein [Propioniferax innocua]|uniref:Uncharacterized protein n=1 Tax=Propioniferax innocua TaxID=1753 RepID=A0A542ZD87_9ACTN|nr:hypothetical protein [Propioniferax innocua]TQL58220.1 hypothetical protein FB460_2075 [Propioniferax innocua]